MSDTVELTNDMFPVLKDREFLFYKNFIPGRVLSVYKNTTLNVYEVFLTYIQNVLDYNETIKDSEELNTPQARGKTIGKRIMITLLESAAAAYTDELAYFHSSPLNTIKMGEMFENIDQFLYIINSRSSFEIETDNDAV